MKFGKDFKKQKVPEWIEAYVDYNGLKHILHKIHSFRQNNPNLARASQRRSSLQDGNIEAHEDIENQIIAVQTVQQENSRKLYNTRLIMSPTEEGEGNERSFFKKLDDELNKTNNFYKDKVEEMIKEAASLKKQMEALIALRIKVINSNSDESGPLKCNSREINNLVPSKIIPPDNESVEQVDRKPGVEMSYRSRQQPGSSGGDAKWTPTFNNGTLIVILFQQLVKLQMNMKQLI